MSYTKFGMVVLSAALLGMQAACAALPPAPSGNPAVCRLAAVSPVSGHAECIEPPGAPVDPPPPRPDAPPAAQGP